MLFFVDESWQTVGTQSVGALGAVAIPTDRYNRYCQEFFSIKRRVLGAAELKDSEIRGQHAFAKSAFKRESIHGDSHWLKAVREVFDCLERNHAQTFVIWTVNQQHATLRSAQATVLSKPYKQLLHDFRAFMMNRGDGTLGALNFDQRGLAEDAATGSAIANYLVRTQSGWHNFFIQIPNFTVSAVSPGLQAADVVAHLGAHLADRSVRPELSTYIERMFNLRYEYARGPKRVRCSRQII